MAEKTEIASWWAQNPMTYGSTHGRTEYDTAEKSVRVSLGTKEFFEMADSRFLEWNQPLWNEDGPFGGLFPFERFCEKKVLEIGCGMGFMASLWARNGADVTAVDLNSTSIEQTRRRFELLGLKGTIERQDANSLSFQDGAFDYAYSWGVLHHSPNLEKSISEMFRVLKTGGEFGIMLYSRHSFQYLYHILYVEGFLHGESRFLDQRALASRYGDGHRERGNPHTWPVTKKELKKMIGPLASELGFRVLGTDLDSTFSYLFPGTSRFFPKAFKKVWARRLGWSLWASGKK